MSTNSDKMKRYERLAVKNPKYYVSIGNIYIEEGAFKAATIYYQKAVDNGVLALTVSPCGFSTMFSPFERRKRFFV